MKIDIIFTAIEKYTHYLGLKAIVVIKMCYLNDTTCYVVFSNGKKLLIKFVTDKYTLTHGEFTNRGFDAIIYVRLVCVLHEKCYYNYIMSNHSNISLEIQQEKYEAVNKKMFFFKEYVFDFDRMENIVGLII